MQCWKAGAALAHKAFSDDGRFTDVNELNFRLIATQGVQVTVGNRTYEGAATMLKPLGPNYIDNGRVGVSQDIVPIAAAAPAPAAAPAAAEAAAPAAAAAPPVPPGGGARR